MLCLLFSIVFLDDHGWRSINYATQVVRGPFLRSWEDIP